MHRWKTTISIPTSFVALTLFNINTIHTHIHVYIHTHTDIQSDRQDRQTDRHTYIHTLTYIHTYMHACLPACMPAYLPTNMPTYLAPLNQKTTRKWKYDWGEFPRFQWMWSPPPPPPPPHTHTHTHTPYTPIHSNTQYEVRDTHALDWRWVPRNHHLSMRWARHFHIFILVTVCSKCPCEVPVTVRTSSRHYMSAYFTKRKIEN